MHTSPLRGRSTTRCISAQCIDDLAVYPLLLEAFCFSHRPALRGSIPLKGEEWFLMRLYTSLDSWSLVCLRTNQRQMRAPPRREAELGSGTLQLAVPVA